MYVHCDLTCLRTLSNIKLVHVHICVYGILKAYRKMYNLHEYSVLGLVESLHAMT